MIDAAQIDLVAGALQRGGSGTDLVEALRAQMPGLHFTYCMDDDVVGAQPVRSVAGFNLYLVDGRNHCLCFTQDPDAATGLVLAELEDE